MKKSLSMILFLSVLLIANSSGPYISFAPAPKGVKNSAVGTWVNKYQDNQSLKGIYVQQFPDCQDDYAKFEGHHPAMIIYVFKDGRANQIGYNPDGAIKEDFWFKTNPGDWLWNQVTPPNPKSDGSTSNPQMQTTAYGSG
jgi:hypothetical protein